MCKTAERVTERLEQEVIERWQRSEFSRELPEMAHIQINVGLVIEAKELIKTQLQTIKDLNADKCRMGHIIKELQSRLARLEGTR